MKYLNVPKAIAAWNAIQPLSDRDRGIDDRFLTEPDEKVWWDDGQRVEFRTPNYAKILRIMQSQLSVTIDSLREQLGINKSAVQSCSNARQHLFRYASYRIFRRIISN